jgi:hypothetical protein
VSGCARRSEVRGCAIVQKDAVCRILFLIGSSLRDIVCMEQPKGMTQDHKSKFFCMLDNSLYGLMVPRKIYKRFESFTMSQNFSKGSSLLMIYLMQAEAFIK